MPSGARAVAIFGAPRTTRVLLWLLGAFAIVALLVLASAYGYFRMFSQFAAYDDEGYVMQSVRSFLEGHALYDDVYSQYGPAFYLLQDIVHGLFRLPLTHDVVRLTALAMWVGIAAATAGVVIRITRSLALAAIAFVHVFVHLIPLTNEPGHPQTLLGLTVAVACLVAVSSRGEITRTQAVWCGILAAFTAFVKINVGVYLLLGLAIPLVLASPLGRLAGPLLILVAAGLPVLLMREHLRSLSADYALVGAMSAAAVTLTSWRLLRPPSVAVGTLTAFATAVAATSGVIVLAILALGTSPSALVQGILIRPARLTTVFYMPVMLPHVAALASLGALPLAALLTWRRISDGPAWSAIVFVAKAAFAIGALYASNIGYVELMGYATPFVWILMLPVAREQPSRSLVPRAILAAVATFELLQAYPVGGTQVPFATFPMIVPAIICVYDAMAIIAAPMPAPRVALVVLQVIVLVWAKSAYTPVIGKEVVNHFYAVYMGNEGVRLPGTQRLRLTPPEVARLQWLAGTLRANCSSFVALPGFQSLHPWTDIPPLTTKNAGTWMTLLDEQEQQQLWATADARRTPCAVLRREVALGWTGIPAESLPSYAQLTTRFRTLTDVDGYELMVRRDDPQDPPFMMALLAGRQTFGTDRAPVHVASQFVNVRPASTIRTWIRTTKRGAILWCQAEPSQETGPAHPVPLLYIGRSGKLYGQHDSGTVDVAPTRNVVNDGRWHHVALVRSGSTQSLFVDGLLEHSTAATNSRLIDCRAGTGFTTGWPDSGMGWMDYTGDIESLGVHARAWTANDVTDDMRKTTPND